MGNNPSFFQCNKTSKTLFNPKTPQNSSLNILKKSKTSFPESQVHLPGSFSLIQHHFETESQAQSFSTATPSNSQLPIKHLENYTIERKICDSSKSSLMLMRCKKDRSQLFVLKIVEQWDLASSVFSGYLRQISSIGFNNYLAEVKHSFIGNNCLYLIMEFCPGGPFLDLIRSQRRFSEDVARFYLAEIVLGLETLSTLPIHRFLSVEDILLDLEGHIKISNYGGEKTLFNAIEPSEDNESDDEEHSRFGCDYKKLSKNRMTSVNTDFLSYVPPEMLENGKANCSDLWLIGVLLYQMLAGHPPFSLQECYQKSNTAEKIKSCIKENEPKFSKNISDTAKELIWGLLMKHPMDRIGYNGWKEVKNHRFFEGFPWKEVERKLIPAPFSNSFKKKEEFKSFWKIQENQVKKPGVYLEKTFFVGGV